MAFPDRMGRTTTRLRHCPNGGVPSHSPLLSLMPRHFSSETDRNRHRTGTGFSTRQTALLDRPQTGDFGTWNINFPKTDRLGLLL